MCICVSLHVGVCICVFSDVMSILPFKSEDEVCVCVCIYIVHVSVFKYACSSSCDEHLAI